MEARIAKKSYLEVEWYECKEDNCDGPRGIGEAGINVVRAEASTRGDGLVEVRLLDVNGDDTFYLVPREVLKAMSTA